MSLWAAGLAEEFPEFHANAPCVEAKWLTCVVMITAEEIF